MVENEEQNIDVDRINRLPARLAEAMNGENIKSFGKKCGLSDTSIRKYLEGKAQPKAANLKKIALVTGKSTSWLLGEEDDRKVRDFALSKKVDGAKNDLKLLNNLFMFLPIDKRSRVLKILLKEVNSYVEDLNRYR